MFTDIFRFFNIAFRRCKPPDMTGNYIPSFILSAASVNHVNGCLFFITGHCVRRVGLFPLPGEESCPAVPVHERVFYGSFSNTVLTAFFRFPAAGAQVPAFVRVQVDYGEDIPDSVVFLFFMDVFLRDQYSHA